MSLLLAGLWREETFPEGALVGPVSPTTFDVLYRLPVPELGRTDGLVIHCGPTISS